MYKKITPLLITLFLGCANTNINIKKNINQNNIENTLINKYEITTNALTKLENNYYFYKISSNGITIYKLNKDYQITNTKNIAKLINPSKIVSKNSLLYLIGYDENEQKPILLTLNKDLKLLKVNYIGDKYDLPKDILITPNKITILLLTYKNGADIKICNIKDCITFKKPYNQLPKFIKKYKYGYIIVGSEQKNQEDLYITYIKNGKIVWEKTYDFGLDDTPKKVKINNNNIIIDFISTDYMGGETYYTITLDKNGNIIKKQKNLEFKQLPTRFRT